VKNITLALSVAIAVSMTSISVYAAAGDPGVDRYGSPASQPHAGKQAGLHGRCWHDSHGHEHCKMPHIVHKKPKP
jgi:hypothetical protein